MNDILSSSKPGVIICRLRCLPPPAASPRCRLLAFVMVKPAKTRQHLDCKPSNIRSPFVLRPLGLLWPWSVNSLPSSRPWEQGTRENHEHHAFHLTLQRKQSEEVADEDAQ